MIICLLPSCTCTYLNLPYVRKPDEMGQWKEVKQELQKLQQRVENIAEGNAEVAEHITAAISLLTR